MGLEERMRELENIDDSFDDDQLSRLGINNFVRDDVVPTGSLITDLSLNFDVNSDTLLVANNHGITSLATVGDMLRLGVRTDTLTVNQPAHFMDTVHANRDIELIGQLRHNGTDVVNMVYDLLSRVTNLEEEVRRLKE